ncbi:enoyl-CoA hydratase/isomerase family protein [Nocardia callitridis]
MSISEVASGVPSLDLDANGVARRPLTVVDLGSPASGDVVRAATDSVRAAVGLVVGVTDGDISSDLAPLVEAFDLTVGGGAGAAGDRRLVAVDDASRALTELDSAVTARPNAALVLGHVLRDGQGSDVRAALAREAAAYSMLLSGAEFADWLTHRGRARARPEAREAPLVAVERTGDVLDIVLSRTAKRNAMDHALREELVEALTIAVSDDGLRVVLSGAGPAFCAGGDLDEFGSATDYCAAYLVRLERHPGWLVHRVRERITAHVHGACIGAGVEMPSFAGRVVAASDARFALPEVSMGLIPGAGGTVSIPWRIGRWRTAWLALTGQPIDAHAALRWGLVDEVTDGD